MTSMSILVALAMGIGVASHPVIPLDTDVTGVAAGIRGKGSGAIVTFSAVLSFIKRFHGEIVSLFGSTFLHGKGLS